MKLTSEQVDKVREQTGLNPFPEDVPVAEDLKQHFGDHTFYVDPNGLYVWEELGPAEGMARPATAVMIAAFGKEDEESEPVLTAIQPQQTNAVVDLSERG